MDFSNAIHSTAGAIPFINEKGDVSMQKVKVQRYITGKRPAYAPISDHELSGDERDVVHESEESFSFSNIQFDEDIPVNIQDTATLVLGQRRAEPEIIYEASEDIHFQEKINEAYESDDNDRDLCNKENLIKRHLIRERLKNQEEHTYDVLEYEDEFSDKELQLSSEYEEYTDSEEEIGHLRLKPFFVKKSDRNTIPTKEEQAKEIIHKQREKQNTIEVQKVESHKILEDILLLERQKDQGGADVEQIVNTDDENDEIEYEKWKLRELKRVKKAREDIERFDKERDEVEQIHLMSDRERKHEFEQNPRFIPNMQPIDKQYKFLQKYYHRGVFFMNKDEEVFKRDFSKPTLEDHFNKQVLPKVMQVKNFGRSGRTKYTHLLDQDTTQKDDNPWAHSDLLAIKYQNKGGGMKQNFERPTSKKIKLNRQS